MYNTAVFIVLLLIIVNICALGVCLAFLYAPGSPKKVEEWRNIAKGMCYATGFSFVASSVVLYLISNQSIN